jgi:hypothetical protein
MSRPRYAAALLALGAEAVLLAHVAGLEAARAAAFAALAVAAGSVARPWPGALEALAYGGLGMTFGWWADLGFAALAPAASPELPPEAWCGSASALAGIHFASWMNLGMLAGAALAARIARCTTQRFALECVCMLLAMHLSARAVASLDLAPALAVLAPHAAMSADMLAGMQLGRLEDVRRALAARLRAARLAAG